MKKYGRRPAGSKSIYDTSDNDANGSDGTKSSTLPGKNNKDNKMRDIPDTDSEMSLRQFGSITDLLTKLRADLRASFPRLVDYLQIKIS